MAHRLCARLFLLLSTAVSGADPGGDLLTLDSAIDLALRQNRTVHGAALAVRQYDDRMAAARTRRLPQISVYALGAERLTPLNFRFERGALGNYPGLGPIPGEDTTIRAPIQFSALLIGQVSQPLSQQYRIGLGLQQLDLAKQAALEEERARRQSVTGEVKRTYYGILQAEAALAAVEESIKLFREVDRITGEYVVQQVALKADNLDAKTRLAKAEYDAETIRHPLETQKELLNSLLGRDLATPFRVNVLEEIAWTDTDLAAARALALERRPELRQARLRVRIAGMERRLKRAEYIPDVSLTLNYFSPLNYGSLIPANIAAAGLLLTWEPFDWGRKRHELAEKSRAIEEAELAEREAANRVAIEVNGKYRKLRETVKLLDVARLQRESAQEKLRVTTNRFKQDVALMKDVLERQAAVAEAHSGYAQALQAFWTARAEFEKALGEDR